MSIIEKYCNEYAGNEHPDMSHPCVKQFASPQHHNREIICSVSFTSNAIHSIKASKGLADSSLFILNIYINAL